MISFLYSEVLVNILPSYCFDYKLPTCNVIVLVYTRMIKIRKYLSQKLTQS